MKRKQLWKPLLGLAMMGTAVVVLAVQSFAEQDTIPAITWVTTASEESAESEPQTEPLETEADSASNIEDIESALECMEQAVRQKIRKVDVCTRYSSMQYLIILFEADEKRIPNIMERIFGQYREQCGKKNLLSNYDYMSMTEK